MGAATGDVMLLTPPAWGLRVGICGVWIFSGLYWTRFFYPAIYVLSLKFKFSREHKNAAFKTGFRVEPDKLDKTASLTANFLPIIQCCGFMWLPEREYQESLCLLQPELTPNLKQHIPWYNFTLSFLQFCSQLPIKTLWYWGTASDPGVLRWPTIPVYSWLGYFPEAGLPVLTLRKFQVNWFN